MISARWRPCRCPEVAKLCWTTCEAVSLTLGFCQLFPVGVTREIPSAPSHLLMPCEEILLPPTEQAQAQSSQLLPSYCITRCKLGDLGILQRMMYIGFFSPPVILFGKASSHVWENTVVLPAEVGKNLKVLGLNCHALMCNDFGFLYITEIHLCKSAEHICWRLPELSSRRAVSNLEAQRLQ